MSISVAAHHRFNSYLVSIVWIAIIYLVNLLLMNANVPLKME